MIREEILRRLERVVGRAPGVSGAAYFGSIAQGRADSFSDVDLLVRCNEDAARTIVVTLHGVLEIVLYRPFGAGRSPSGRYWFRAAHPFARLDVSFHQPSSFDELLRSGGPFARPPFRHLTLGNGHSARAEPSAWMSPYEHDEFALALRNFQESAKAVVRGRTPKHPLTTADEAVQVARARHVRPEAWSLYERSWEQLEGVGLAKASLHLGGVSGKGPGLQ